MPPRRAVAPRLIDWTGERAVPWSDDVQVVYEHYHRYFWARQLVAGRTVLDVGSGEGFGAALLADVATTVTGIDIDEQTVEHSTLNYAAPNLAFRVGTAMDMRGIASGSIEAVVAFEVIEHVEDQAATLREIARVLAPQGIVIMSTPDRRTYRGGEDKNPFHITELSEAEFRETLGTTFAEVVLFGQRASAGSRIERVDGAGDGPRADFQLERTGNEWREAGRMAPVYLIAVAAREALPPLPADSSLSDYGLGVVEQVARATAEQRAQYEQRLAELGEELTREQDGHRAAAGRVDELVAELDATVAQEIQATRERTRLLAELAAASESYEQSAQAMRRELLLVRESVTWSAFQRVRHVVYSRLGGTGSRRARVLSGALRAVGTLRKSSKPTAAPAVDAELRAPVSFVLPSFAEPLVSIVIAVHDGAQITHRCLGAILASTERVRYEVIVVDDDADAETKALLAGVEGISVLVNETNLGYLRSVNRGSAAARGRYIVQLNNDTEPQPGWLEALVDRVESAADIGVVVPKLVFLDGVLQEAGGIIWQDGTGANYGRGQDAADAKFQFVREVDYGSAAALLVRTELWNALGGFDERFVPGYYEDTDLCFAARDRGWRVMYEPRAVVIHVEGASMGTDITTGGKRYQEVNRAKFVAKWKDALELQEPGQVPGFMHLPADRRKGSFVLVVDHRVPSPDRDSGSLRMWHILKNLTALGHRVVFLPDNGFASKPYTERLEGMGVEVLHGALDLPARLAGIAGETDLVILCRPYVAARYLHLVREYVPQARVAYDTVDLHYVRELGRGALEGNPDTTKADGLRELEHALSRACDVALTVSLAEAERLATDAPGVVVDVVPNANVVWDAVPGPESRSGLLFVGGFEHTPNVDAALTLVKQVMPLVWREMPNLQLTIVGGQAPPQILALSASNVRLAGWVEDLDPLLAKASAMVAPLSFGAGVKGKVTQSLAAGLPVVTSSFGAEGIHAQHGRDLLVAEDPAGLAAQVVALLRDPDQWRELSRNGQTLIRKVSSPDAQREALVRLTQR